MLKPTKNKNAQKTTVQEEPNEFDYDRLGSDDVYDQMRNTPQPLTAIPDVREIPTVTMAMQPIVSPEPVYNNPELIMSDRAQLLYLIEGRVRMVQIGSPASNPIFSDQKRLVWAYTFEEAVTKFSNYFADISTDSQRYTVDAAGGSESIS